MVGLLVACLLPQLALAQGPADAVVLAIDCGPRDEPYFVAAKEDVGAASAAWVPLDGSDRSTGWSSAAPQFIEYRVADGLEPGPYEVRAWFAVQQDLKLRASLAIDEEPMAGGVLVESPAGSGYTPFSLTARHTVERLPLTLRLSAEQVPGGDRIRAIRIEFVSLNRLTADGNVARTAEVTVSSQLSGEYPISALTDGERTYRGTTRGRSFASQETPEEHWAEFALARREAVERVSIWWPKYPEVYNAASELLIEVPDGDGWRAVGDAGTPVARARSQVRFTPVETDRIRLLMPASRGAAQRPNILWMNEVEILRGAAPAPRTPRGRTRVTWRRAEEADWLEPLPGGEVDGQVLVLLAQSEALGPPVIVEVTPPAARDAYDWWWDGATLADARPESGRVHHLVFAPQTPEAPPVESLTLAVPGRCELVRHDDLRVLPPPYRPTPRLTDADFFAALDLTREDLREVAEAVGREDWDAAAQAFVQHVRTRTSPPPTRVSQSVSVQPDDEPPDQEAERFLNHEWYFYKHHEWRPLGEIINWYLPDGDGSDRHYISRLDLADYMIDRWEREGGDRWVRGYLDIIRQFYTNAPSPAAPPLFPASHLPWCALCSSIRVRNLLEDYFRITDSPLLSTQDHMLVYKMVLEHGRFLAKCDAGQLFPANHQMGHLVALEIITGAFPEFRETTQWRPYLNQFLREHLRHDTFADGGSVDTAPGYGLWVAAGLFTDAWLYAEDAGLDLGDEWRRRLETMYEWCLKIGTPEGGYLAIGDDSYLLADGDFRFGAASIGLRGALLFGRPDFLWFADRPGATALSETARRAAARELLGARADSALANLSRLDPHFPAFLSANLPDTGWTIMRSDWSAEAVYLFANHHRGGHTHKTQNDINLVAYGRPFITDSGMPHTYSTDRWQNWYLTTRAHNTVMVDGQDMAMGVGDRGTFFTSPHLDFLRVTHDRYAALGVRAHQRNVLYLRDNLFVIDDHVTGEGSHEFAWLAHFQPLGLTVDDAAGLVRTTDPGPGLTVATAEPGTVQVSEHHGWMNVPSTEVCEEVEGAPYIALTKTAVPPVGFGVALCVAREGAPQVSISSCGVDPSVGAAYHVAWSDGSADVAFTHGEPSKRSLGPVTTDALAAGRVETSSGAVRLFVVGGTRVRSGDLELRLATGAGSVAAELAGDRLAAWTDGTVDALLLSGAEVGSASLDGQPASVERTGDAVRIARRPE